MTTKFQAQEKVEYDGKEAIVVSASKNFATKKLTYLLDNGKKVSEDELSKLDNKGNKNIASPALLALREQYAKLIGKDVPMNKKNNIKWIKTKIKGASPMIKDDVTDPPTPWELLVALDQEHLESFIKEKELDIDPTDYSKIEELRQAVADELEIEVPE